MTAVDFPDEMSLGEARAKLRMLVDEGHTCPCCTQFAKVYKRTIHSSMAQALIRIYRTGHITRDSYNEWVVVADVLTHRQVADVAKLAYWELIQPEPEAQRRDGSKRVGRWRVTSRGLYFVTGQASVPKYARVYDGRVLGWTGEGVTIVDCLGKKFDYRELMYG